MLVESSRWLATPNDSAPLPDCSDLFLSVVELPFGRLHSIIFIAAAYTHAIAEHNIKDYAPALKVVEKRAIQTNTVFRCFSEFWEVVRLFFNRMSDAVNSNL